MSANTPGADQLQALINYANTKTGANDATLSDAIARLISGYGGGASVDDAIVIKSRDANGYATEIDYYNSDGIIPTYAFGNSRGAAQVTGWAFSSVTKVNLKGSDSFRVNYGAFYMLYSLTSTDWDKIVEFPDAASNNSSVNSSCVRSCRNLKTVNMPNLTGGLPLYCFAECTALETVIMPKISALCGYANNRGCFGGCTSLKNATFGSIGYPVTEVHASAFYNVTQSDLTITIFTNAAYIDTAVANARTSATGATIVIKASENLTYNGVSYSAGDTVLTSTP